MDKSVDIMTAAQAPPLNAFPARDWYKESSISAPKMVAIGMPWRARLSAPDIRRGKGLCKRSMRDDGKRHDVASGRRLPLTFKVLLALCFNSKVTWLLMPLSNAMLKMSASRSVKPSVLR